MNNSMQLHQPTTAQKQRGAFLVIALILLIVLSALGVAAMSIANTSERVSHNYSEYLASQIKSISMTGYGERILDTFANGLYPGPGTCSTAGTCNVVDSTFPMNSRPLLPWSSGAGTTAVFGASQTDAWWNTNGLTYGATFAGSGNSRIVVAFLGADTTTSPYQNTYRITGYATDSTGLVKTTYQYFHVWNAYPADPGDGTCGGGCLYTQCCSGATLCGSDATSCSTSSATYVPPGWMTTPLTCNDYYGGSGLGYTGTVCANPITPPL